MGMGDGRVGIYSMVFDGSNWKKVDNVYSLTGELNSRFGNNITNTLRASFTFNKIGFVSPERRYEAPTVARPPQM